MALPWFVILIIQTSILIVVAVIVTCIVNIMRKRRQEQQEETEYKKLPMEQPVNEEQQIPTKMGQKRDKFSRKDRFQQSTESYDSTQALYFSDGYPIVTNVKESNAEPCGSDSELLEQDSIGVYDYNPQQWRVTNDEPLKSLSDLPQLQVSLIYNLQKKYIAGKITKIKGLRSVENGGPGQIKIHVTLLPADKYITKTQYHNVSTSRLDEYFKMKFKKFPKLNDTNIRYRVYGRRLKFGMSTKESCIGEMFIYLTDIAAATGGVTMWKTLLPKGHAKIVTVPE